MARNEEKAQSMLSRYLQTKSGASRNRRPHLAILCDDVDEAVKWRRQVVSDIRRKVAEIQNPGLGEEKTRELNDSINKLLRERKHWERRIVGLGGRWMGKRGSEQEDAVGGKEGVFENNGYWYFGAAKELPEAKEVLEREKKRAEKKEENGEELLARLNEGYFGFWDDKEKGLEEMEKREEEKARKELIQEWEGNGGKGVDEKWDEGYLKYVGRKPAVDMESDLQAIMLERKKAQALEQLAGGVIAQDDDDDDEMN